MFINVGRESGLTFLVQLQRSVFLLPLLKLGKERRYVSDYKNKSHQMSLLSVVECTYTSLEVVNATHLPTASACHFIIRPAASKLS